ncbi:amino acid ABC transporter permease [Treponema zioleckii]|uniref:amino acid ABC transporter permease n=1 Tax=Treponema zioleckii TaxID=331680 RepID=UPI00168B6C9C|nr:amino acid ABC transporter permease [Treponema zioleckii]
MSSTEFLSATTALFLLRGLATTLLIAVCTIVLSFLIGAILGVSKFSGKGLAAKISSIYIDIARNLPLILMIIAFRFTLPLPTIASSITALTFLNCALVAEIIRSGMASIPKGQWEAAYSQGFSYTGTLIHVVIPQAVKRIRKPLVGQFVTILKDTSLCAVVAVHELMYSGQIIMGKYVKSSYIIALYALIAVVYFCINSLLLYVSKKVVKEIV